MRRQEIIDLIHNEYDPAPAHYKMGDNWDDGSGRIADAVMARIEALEAALRAIWDVSLDRDHEAATMAVTTLARAALAPEQDK